MACRLLRLTAWSLVLLAAVVLAGVLWLRQSPCRAGITLFSEATRVENFRSMDRVLPSRPMARAGPVWAFDRDPRPLPVTCAFAGAERNLAAFLARTETTGLPAVQRGAITHEEYPQRADETAPFTSWSMAKSAISALIGIALEEGHIASLRDPIAAYVPGLAGTRCGAVPIEEALAMSLGIGFDEDQARATSDINMNFLRTMAMGQPLVALLAGLQAVRPPGEFNDNISSDTMALGLALEAARHRMNDHRAIRVAPSWRRFRPEDAAEAHRRQRAWLNAALKSPFAGCTLVVTHHAPHPGCVPADNPTMAVGIFDKLMALWERLKGAAAEDQDDEDDLIEDDEAS